MDEKAKTKAIKRKDFLYAAELIGNGDVNGEENELRDLYIKEEEKLSNYTSEDCAMDLEMDDYKYEGDELKQEKEQRFYKLGVSIKRYLKDYDWADKIIDETLKRAKSLKYHSDFLFSAILNTKAYDKENEKRIIEFLSCIETNGTKAYKATAEYDDELMLYNDLYVKNTKSTDFEKNIATYYDREKAESYLKKAENAANNSGDSTKHDYLGLSAWYFEFGDKDKALEMIEKVKEKSNLNDAYEVKDIIGTYLEKKMVEEATAFVDEAIQNIDDGKEIAEIQKYLKEEIERL